MSVTYKSVIHLPSNYRHPHPYFHSLLRHRLHAPNAVGYWKYCHFSLCHPHCHLQKRLGCKCSYIRQRIRAIHSAALDC